MQKNPNQTKFQDSDWDKRNVPKKTNPLPDLTFQ